MAKDDAINGARFAYAAYDAFQAAVAQELGLQRTLALQAKALGSLGIAQGEMLKRQAGIEEADIQPTPEGTKDEHAQHRDRTQRG